MPDRFCTNCGHELRSEDRFCPNCGRATHETAVLPTPEADVAVPPLPISQTETGADDPRVIRGGAALPISETERTRQLDVEVGNYLQAGYFVQHRTPTTAQLFMPKHFSFLWALLWFLVFGIGIIVYLIYYAAKKDLGVYLEVDEYGAVRETLQGRRFR